MSSQLGGSESHHITDQRFLGSFYVSCTLWRGMSPEQVPKHFAKLLSWRHSHNADTLRTAWCPSRLGEMNQVIPFGTHSAVAKNGGIVYIERPGVIDPWAAIRFPTDDLARLKITHFEALSDRVAESGFRPITLVVDLGGLQLGCYYPPALWRAQAVIDVMQRGYSDGHGIPGSRIYITNAPSFLPLFWRFIRPLLRRHLQELVHITPQGDYESLHERVCESKMLPISLGGAATFDVEYATFLG